MTKVSAHIKPKNNYISIRIIYLYMLVQYIYYLSIHYDGSSTITKDRDKCKHKAKQLEICL